jgi:hypothetical protein
MGNGLGKLLAPEAVLHRMLTLAHFNDGTRTMNAIFRKRPDSLRVGGEISPPAQRL